MKNLISIFSFISLLLSCTSENKGPPPPEQVRPFSKQIGLFSREELATRKQKVFVEGRSLEEIAPTRCGFKVYKINYQTLNPMGVAVPVSGLLALPIEVQSGPLVSYQHGTVTNRKDVPSNLEYSRETMSIGLLFGGSCYAIAAADYVGLGDSGEFHPYLHARTEAGSASDLITQVITFLSSEGFSWNKQLFLLGYSQGGHSTMALHRQLQESGLLEVTASAPMAGPYDLSKTTMKLGLQNPSARTNTYGAYLAMTLHRLYGYPLEQMVLNPYAQTLPSLYNGELSEKDIQSALPPLDPKKLFTEQFRKSLIESSDQTITRALTENDVYQWVSKAPIRFVHGRKDRDVAFENAIVAHQYMSERGADSKIIEFENLTHATSFMPALIFAHGWFSSLVK